MTTLSTPPDALAVEDAFDEVKATLEAARKAIDDYSKTRADFIEANRDAFTQNVGPAHLDVRQSQDRLRRLVELIVLTFHPDMQQLPVSLGLALNDLIIRERMAARVALGQQQAAA